MKIDARLWIGKRMVETARLCLPLFVGLLVCLPIPPPLVAQAYADRTVPTVLSRTQISSSEWSFTKEVNEVNRISPAGDGVGELTILYALSGVSAQSRLLKRALTAAELASLLAVSPDQIYALARKGILPLFRVGTRYASVQRLLLDF